MTWRRAVLSLVLFGIAFGYVEAAVVVYLRHIYQPIRMELHPGRSADDLFPLITPEQLTARGGQYDKLLLTELGREFATLIMLAAAALAVSRNFRQWLAGFVLAFGIWDLVFYLFLKLILGWPQSFMTWDILFLLPVPWVGPVLAPCIVAATMVFAGILLLRRELGGTGLRLDAKHWFGVVAGGIILMVAFMWDWRNTMAGNPPNGFNWPLFALGEMVGVGSFLHAGRRKLIALAAVAILVMSPSLSAQDTQSDLRRQIDAERKAGRIAATEPLLEQLLDDEQHQSGDTSEKLIPILDQLARLAIASGRFDRAELLYSRSISIVETAEGKSAAALIPVLHAAVRVQHIAGNFPAAENLLLRAISVRIQNTGPQTPEIASDYILLARLYAAQSKFSQAAGVYSWALDIQEKLFGLDDARLLPALDGIASASREEHNFEKALAVLGRAAPIREANVGPMHPDLAQTLDNMGHDYFALKRFEEAEAVYTRSLPIWIKNLGPNHPMIATSLDNLGVTFAAQSKFDKAEEVYRQALSIRDTQEVFSLRNLALVFAERKKYAEAEPLFKRALTLLTAPSAELVATLKDYADTLDHLKRKTEAARLRARARSMDKPAAKEVGEGRADH